MVNDLTWEFPKLTISFHHITSLHWPPIDTQTQYKLASLCYSDLPLLATWLLSELLQVYKPAHQLDSSSDTAILCLPSVCMHSLGQRSFSYAAPSVWNSLPWKVRSSNTLTSFKSYIYPIDSVCVCVWAHACTSLYGANPNKAKP